MPLSDNLRRAYRFNESGGSTTADEGPDNEDGTITGATLGSGLMTCDAGGDRADFTPITLSADWTIAFRGKQTSSDANGVVSGNRAATNSFLFMYGGNYLQITIGGADHRWTALTTFTSDADYCLIYDATADTLNLYKDGALVTGSPITSVTSGTITISAVGSGLSTDAFSLIGTLDYYYVWDRALSGADAAAVDADPDSMFGSPATPLAPPLFHRSQRFFTRRR